jgi:hypothetical protein
VYCIRLLSDIDSFGPLLCEQLATYNTDAALRVAAGVPCLAMLRCLAAALLDVCTIRATLSDVSL